MDGEGLELLRDLLEWGNEGVRYDEPVRNLPRPDYDSRGYYCQYCHADFQESPFDFKHLDCCPIVRARNYLKRRENEVG